ncbi:MAG: hypothetical protein ACTHNS_16170 [Marmoricola sp.]
MSSAAAIVAALLLSGCTASAESHSEPAIAVRTITSTGQIDLPLARFGTTASDQQAMFDAANVEQRRCGQQFGVDYTQRATSQLTEIQNDTVRRYGIVNADEVAKYGYDLPPTPGQGGDDKNAAGAWNPGPREAEVMEGHTASGSPSQIKAADGTSLPFGGCGTQGFREVWGGKRGPQNDTLIGQYLGDAWAETMADSRARAVAAKWATCMAGHGYHFKHRWDAGNSVATASSAVKLAMAKLDLSCALEVNYIGVWYAVDSAYQRRLIDQHEGELNAAMTQYHRMMERVRRILQGGS